MPLQLASSLYRRHAWVVTGTPITSRLGEVLGLCEFLAFEPFHHEAAWGALIHQPFQSRSMVGLLSLR